jgi:polar amino acid transport system substrate-binding protein
VNRIDKKQKKPTISTVLSIWMFFIVVVSAKSLANEVSIVVEESPPYVDQARVDHGMVTALVIEAFKRVDISSTVSFANWSRVEQDVDDNRAISFMWSKTKPLLKKWVFSEPIYLQKNKFAVLKPYQPDIHLLHNLRGIKLGLTKGFGYGNQLDAMRNKLNVSEFESEYMAMKGLFEHKVAIIVIDPPVAIDLAKKYFSKQNQQQLSFINTTHFDSTSYYLVCSKRYGNCINYIKKFNQGLAMISKDGSRHRLLMKAEQKRL